MLNKSERDAFIRLIEELPNRLVVAVTGLDDGQLDTPYRDGGWTVRQVVHHLFDAHVNVYIRIRLMLCEDNPPIKAYSQDDWARLPDNRMPVVDSLLGLKGLHARLAAMFRAMPDSAWQRTAQHPEHGTVTIERWLEVYANHGEKHLKHITDLKTRMGW